MDITTIEGFLGGVATLGISLFGYARIKGFNLFAIGDLIKAAEGYRALNAEVRGAIGNISLSELGGIITEAQELSTDGYTQAEIEELAKKLIDAAASK